MELLLDIWRNCTAGDKDFVAIGDMNLCAKRWTETSYEHKDLANKVVDFMYEEECSQLVDSFTRIRSAQTEELRWSLVRFCLGDIEAEVEAVLVESGKE